MNGSGWLATAVVCAATTGYGVAQQLAYDASLLGYDRCAFREPPGASPYSASGGCTSQLFPIGHAGLRYVVHWTTGHQTLAYETEADIGTEKPKPVKEHWVVYLEAIAPGEAPSPAALSQMGTIPRWLASHGLKVRTPYDPNAEKYLDCLWKYALYSGGAKAGTLDCRWISADGQTHPSLSTKIRVGSRFNPVAPGYPVTPFDYPITNEEWDELLRLNRAHKGCLPKPLPGQSALKAVRGYAVYGGGRGLPNQALTCRWLSPSGAIHPRSAASMIPGSRFDPFIRRYPNTGFAYPMTTDQKRSLEHISHEPWRRK